MSLPGLQDAGVSGVGIGRGRFGRAHIADVSARASVLTKGDIHMRRMGCIVLAFALLSNGAAWAEDVDAPIAAEAAYRADMIESDVVLIDPDRPEGGVQVAQDTHERRWYASARTWIILGVITAIGIAILSNETSDAVSDLEDEGYTS